MYRFEIIVEDTKVKSNSILDLYCVIEYLLDNKYKLVLIDNELETTYKIDSYFDYMELGDIYATNSKRL